MCKFILNEDAEPTNISQVANQANTVWDNLLKKTENRLAKKVQEVIRQNLEDMQDCNGDEKLLSRRDPINLLITGPAGTGKSSIVINYLKDIGMNPVVLTGSQLTPTMVTGALFKVDKPATDVDPEEHKAVMLTVDFLKRLNKPNSVLVVDEINRSRQDLRAFLLEIITSHEIPDSTQESNTSFLPNMVCTIAMQNPANKIYGMSNKDDLDRAMKTRFRRFDWAINNDEVKSYLVNTFNAKSNRTVDSVRKQRYKNMAIMADAIISYRGFTFSYDESDDANENNFLNPRTLTYAIRESDGEVDKLLGNNGEDSSFAENCGDVMLPVVEDALDHSPEVKDSMNALMDAIEGGKFDDDISDEDREKLRQEQDAQKTGFSKKFSDIVFDNIDA